ncbi:MAG: penicillin-binding transpeptidase domain-containing protein [Candidatus Paceibacterota bacterium]
MKRKEEIYPDEIFLDSANPSGLDMERLEGRLDKSISKRSILGAGALFVIVALIFLSKLWVIQIVEGSNYKELSEDNRFQYTPVLAERGFIYSRDGSELVWNEANEEKKLERVYTDIKGMAHIVGYSKPPMKDSSGEYYRDHYTGITGIEKYLDETLNGENGLKLMEHDVQGNIYSENFFRRPQAGENVKISIDLELQETFYSFLKEVADESEFRGGTGLIMDVETGELVSAVSFPEYDPSLLASGSSSDAIEELVADERSPFLNRFAGGLFSPGSVIKPFVAVAALEEELLSPEKRLESPATLVVPNPYDPSRFTVFRDWRTHGEVDMYEAIAHSSNIYFYKIGGGYEEQEGLGIPKIDEYVRKFGFGEETGSIFSERAGVIPNPEWKQRNFEDGLWRIGDTYNTSIGQFGFQVTPLQLLRATASLANGGYLLEPKVVLDKEEANREEVGVSEDNIDVVKEGMRKAVTEGTAGGLNLPFVEVAAKTGTAQSGSENQYMNSWITGFFPYEEPKYAFVVVMDKGPSGTLRGSVLVMNDLFHWMNEHRPEYLE